MGPISIGSFVVSNVALRLVADGLDVDLGRRGKGTVLLLVGFVHHHALREHAGERLVHADVSRRLHRAGKEARIQKMQDRVFDAADILIDRHHVVGHGRRSRRVFVPRIGEAREIPRRIDERIHRVGFAFRSRSIAFGASDVLPGRMMVERVARLIEGHIVGKHHWQIFIRHRHDSADSAVDHRDRATPIALSRDTPVAQAEVDLPLGNRNVLGELYEVAAFEQLFRA